MNKFGKGLLVASLLLSGGVAAWSAGYTTNGLPLISPGAAYSNLSYRALLSVDTQLPSGRNPQTVATETFRLAAMSSEMIANQATSTAGAATLNTVGGLVTTEALTTAPGATYVFTLSNSVLLASGPTQAAGMFAIHSKSNTGGQSSAGALGLQISSVVQTAGQAVVTITNNGTSALNGTMLLAFHI